MTGAEPVVFASGPFASGLVVAQSAAATGAAAAAAASTITASQLLARLATSVGLSYVVNRVFAPDGPEGLADPGVSRFSGRDEGIPEKRIFGRTIRTAGTLMWQQWPRTEITSEHGKGPGSSGQFVDTTYTQDAAYEWCRCYGRPISRVLDIYANGEQLWDAQPDIDITSTQIECSEIPSQTTYGSSFYLHFAVFKAPSGGPDLSQFVGAPNTAHANKTLQSSGWTDTDMNGEFRVWEAKTNSDGSTQVKVLLASGTSPTVNPGSIEAAGASITLYQSHPTHQVGHFQDVTHHTGTLTQGPDKTMVGHEGAAEVPAYRDRAYSVFETIRLENFGNVVPQQMEAVIEVDPLETVKTAVDALLDTVGIDASQRDTTDLDGLALRGLDASTGPLDAIFALAIAFNFMIRDVDGVLTFEQRANIPTTTIAQADLVAHEPGEEAPRDVKHTLTNTRALPKTVVVRYIDPAKDYQQAATSYSPQAHNGAQAIETVSLPIVLTSDEAQEIARRIAWMLQVAGHKMSGLRLPPSEVGITAGQVVQFTEGSHTWDMLAESVVTGANDIIEVSGVEEQAGVFTHTTSTDDPG